MNDSALSWGFSQEFSRDPRCVLNYEPAVVWSVPRVELDATRLEVARRKFAESAQSIRMVRELAARSQITAIDSADDLVPLFYRHETFKGYPQSWLEAGDFPRLTRWLGQLCGADVSRVDATGCELIEDWMRVLLDQSAVDLQITAGADGKSAFLPRSRGEWQFLNRFNLRAMQTAEDESGRLIGLRPGADRVPLMYLGARRGARTIARFLNFYEETFGAGLVDTLFEYRDSDLLTLAGRIREASRKGEAGLVQIKPQLLARREEIARLNADAPRRTEALTQRLLNDYRGQRIICRGTMQALHDLARQLREAGAATEFSPDSLFFCGGGFAGGAEPPGWKQEVAETFGIPESSILVLYGMQEALWSMQMCREGKFHVPETIIPYVLSEQDDRPLPRAGRQTGRFAFFDLATDTSWGGYVTNDRVSVTWDERCGCGHPGAFLDSPITTIRESQSEKINCAGTAGALEEATEFLLQN